MNFKTLFSLSVIAMTLVVLSSCSKKDDPSPAIDETNLVGTWLFKSADVAGDVAETDTLNRDFRGELWTFKSDETVTYTFLEGGESRGTWKFENNTLILDKDTKGESFLKNSFPMEFVFYFDGKWLIQLDASDLLPILYRAKEHLLLVFSSTSCS